MSARKEVLAIIIVFLIFSFLFSFISIKRHNNFESQGWDLALYDQVVWLYSQGKNPYSTLTQRLDFADRFRPILLVLVPFYWLKADVKMLLALQAIILASGVFPAFFLAKRILKNFFTALAISLAYVLFPGIQSFIIDDFHEVAFFPPLLLWLFYFFFNRRKRWFFLFLLLCLLIREHLGFFLSSVGLYLMSISKKEKKIGFITFIFSLAWSITIIWLIMPLFGEFRYKDAGAENERLEQTILRYFSNPLQTFSLAIMPLEKIKTVLLSFAAFAFFPIINIPLLLPLTYQFLSRFLDNLHPYRWTLYYHYSGEIAGLMVIGTIFTFKKLSKIITFCSFFLLIAVFCEQIFLPAPLKNLIKKDFYQSKNWAKINNKIIQLIPAKSSVATQNNLAPHLSQREKIYILPEGIGAEYIFVDLRQGQNQWNFFTLSEKKLENILQDLIKTEQYSLMIKEGDSFLLKKKEENQEKAKNRLQSKNES